MINQDPISPAEFKRRLEVARDHTGSDCFGTAYYIVGMKDTDTPGGDHVRFCNTYLKATTPSVGDLAGVVRPQEKRIVHMGVVTSVDPVRITHRPHIEAPLEEGVRTDEFLGPYVHHRAEVFFYKSNSRSGAS